MRVRSLVLVALAATLLPAGRDAGARGLYHRGALSLATDGELGGRGSHSNPSTNVLDYTSGLYELGYRLSNVGVHAGAGISLISGDETSGSGLLLGGGMQALVRVSGLRIVLRTDLAALHASYGFKDEQTSIDALVFEPSLGVELPLGAGGHSALGIQLGPHWKWIMGEAERSPQSGVAVSLALIFGG